MSRYTVKGGYDGQFQPGSNNLVLRNKLGITTEDELERIESLALADAKNAVLEWFEDDTVITSKLIFDLHWLWLRNIYEFAGHRRTVNMSKPGVAFCVANYISTQMEVLEKNFLSTLTPCSALSIQEVSDRVARVHAELLKEGTILRCFTQGLL
jgi:cell filamentation protein